MCRDPTTPSADLSVLSLVEDYLYRYLHDIFPVLEGTEVVGRVSEKHVGKPSRTEWSPKSVSDIRDVCSPKKTVQVDCDAVKGLVRMSKMGSAGSWFSIGSVRGNDLA